MQCNLLNYSAQSINFYEINFSVKKSKTHFFKLKTTTMIELFNDNLMGENDE